jgi:peptidoglycan/LPS O-acetylase OafA/YrhL
VHIEGTGLIYRREVDGLRAIAVIPVILYHLQFAAFAGGYIGVDVFFVISGYLITSVIMEDMERGSFSLAQFYERRVRRIFPALVFMLAVIMPVAVIVLMPSYVRTASGTLAAVALFASNLRYFGQAGYFEQPEHLRLLLNTWTLGVEEQYYLLFPLFMLLASKWRRQWLVATLAVMVAASLALAQWAAYHEPVWGFYLLPSRGWELGLGALAAFYLKLRPNAEWDMTLMQAMSLLGVALIGWSVFTFNDDTPIPSFFTLVPTLGTILIILCASPATLAGRLLGCKPLVGIGLVSYSLYLWHQPLFVLVRQRTLLSPGPATIIIECLALAVIAYLSWRFVEQPFRRRDRFSRKQIFGMALAASALLFAVGMIGHYTGGTFGLDRNAGREAQLEARFANTHGLNAKCIDGLTSASECRTSNQPEILVWGDSFAMQVVPGLLASNPQARIQQATAYMCGPVFGVAPIEGRYREVWADNCIRNNDRVLQFLKATHSVKYVLMGSIYLTYVDPDEKVMLRDGSLVDPPSVSLRYFRATIKAIKALGIEPILVSPPPQSGFDLGLCAKRALFFGRPLDGCDFPLSLADKEQSGEFALLHQLDGEARVIWLTGAICTGGVCRTRVGDNFIYSDSGHLSREGSIYVGQALDLYGRIKRGPSAGQRRVLPQS